jgi:hypothetical protein
MAPITTIVPCTRRPDEPLATIELRLNDRATFSMYIDTARLTTAVSYRVQEVLDLPISRRRIRVGSEQILGVNRAVLESFAIAGFPETTVGPLTVYVTDIQFADGQIGLNYLSRFLRVCYDFTGETLQLTR